LASSILEKYSWRLSLNGRDQCAKNNRATFFRDEKKLLEKVAWLLPIQLPAWYDAEYEEVVSIHSAWIWAEQVKDRN
jgi:hypothetical protein